MLDDFRQILEAISIFGEVYNDFQIPGWQLQSFFTFNQQKKGSNIVNKCNWIAYLCTQIDT